MLYEIPINQGYLLGSIALSVGLLAYGGRVLETVGKKVIILDYQKGFCAQFATSIAIMVGSYSGLPLSSTHCSVGSLLGLSMASYFSTVNDVYSETKVKEENKINMPVMLRIFAWWVLTIPLVGLVTALITYFVV